MTDEEYVRAHWADGLDSESDEETGIFFHHIDTGVNFPTWAAASEFTRERLEQIRQLERDIDFMRQFESSAEDWLEHLSRQRDADENAADVRSACPIVRILARLESALADLRQGMKEFKP